MQAITPAPIPTVKVMVPMGRFRWASNVRVSQALVADQANQSNTKRFTASGCSRCKKWPAPSTSW